MAQRDDRKRLGKKHRHASTRSPERESRRTLASRVFAVRERI
jgi:hypothetical protein